MKTELVRMEQISKWYSKIRVLENVSINVLKGEVLGLVGEPGAGKSTLVKILSGLVKKDTGNIYFEENKIKHYSPQIAQKLGIFSIHQDENLISNINIAENIFFVREDDKKKIIFNKKDIYYKAAKVLEAVGLDIQPYTLVKNLSMAEKQLVQIAKALSMDAKLIIMDEATSALNNNEVNMLKGVINRLKRNNVTIIFISNKLEESIEICERITILRDGKGVGTFKSDIARKKIISLMHGKRFKETVPLRKDKKIGNIVLNIQNISTEGAIKDISFTLKKGEILGITGLIGSGRTELAKALFGMKKIVSGKMFINGKQVSINNTNDAIKNKIALVPEDRNRQGLVHCMTVRDNINSIVLEKSVGKLFINYNIQDYICNEFIKRLNINADKDTKIEKLDGGNQQKVLISKWLATRPEILILDEPTKDMDISSKRDIYSLLLELAKEGMGIILISSEIREVSALCDKIIILKDGYVIGEIKGDEIKSENISDYL